MRSHRTWLLTLMGVPAVFALAAACTSDADWDRGDSTQTVDVVESTVSESTADSLEAALARTMARFEVPGAVVSVDDPEAGKWTATAGVADLDSGEPMSVDLQWPIRSVTKSFVVTALLRLADDGQLSMDDTIDQWVEGIADGDQITLQQLADMTGGLADYTGQGFIEDFSADPTATFTREQLIDYVRDGEPGSAPGEERRYINSSTVLIGEVIEQVTGNDLARELDTSVFEPSGLTDTEYVTVPDGLDAEHATGYQPDDGELFAPPSNFTVFDASGAMTSTLDDLMRWGPVLAEGDLLDDQTQADRLVGGPLLEGPEYDIYATGIGELDGWWGHTGEGFGYTALVMHQPSTGATVTILMNVSGLGEHPPTALFRQIAAILRA